MHGERLGHYSLASHLAHLIDSGQTGRELLMVLSCTRIKFHFRRISSVKLAFILLELSIIYSYFETVLVSFI